MTIAVHGFDPDQSTVYQWMMAGLSITVHHLGTTGSCGDVVV